MLLKSKNGVKRKKERKKEKESEGGGMKYSR